MLGSSSLSKVVLAVGICLLLLAISAIPRSTEGCDVCDTSDCVVWSPPQCSFGVCHQAPPFYIGCGGCVCKTSTPNPFLCGCE